MRINILIVVLLGFLTMGPFLNIPGVKADQPDLANAQVIKDEGYGNDDEEYYNAEDDVANVDDPYEAQQK